jgi:peptidylprolyl isomerase
VVDTAFGDPAAVTVPAPWAIDKSRNKVLSYGNGATVPSGGLVKLDYVGVNGRTGAVFDSSFVAGSPVTFNLSQVVAGFSKGLAGQRVGSRVLLAMPGSDGYDGSDMTSIGIEEGDSLVFVVDIIEAPLSAPAGEQVAAAAGLPVVGGETGKPTLSLPAGAVFPTALTVQPVVQGAGEAVTAASQVQVNYTEYAWSPDGNFRFIRQTYGNSAVAGALSGTIAAWQEGLVGVTQGSRVILVAPPDLAYPEGAAKIGVAKGDASVFVVDVLFA